MEENGNNTVNTPLLFSSSSSLSSKTLTVDESAGTEQPDAGLLITTGNEQEFDHDEGKTMTGGHHSDKHRTAVRNINYALPEDRHQDLLALQRKLKLMGCFAFFGILQLVLCTTYVDSRIPPFRDSGVSLGAMMFTFLWIVWFIMVAHCWCNRHDCSNNNNSNKNNTTTESLSSCRTPGCLVIVLHVVMILFFLPHCHQWWKSPNPTPRNHFFELPVLVAMMIGYLQILIMLFLVVVYSLIPDKTATTTQQHLRPDLGRQRCQRNLKMLYVIFTVASINYLIICCVVSDTSNYRDDAWPLPLHMALTSLLCFLHATFVGSMLWKCTTQQYSALCNEEEGEEPSPNSSYSSHAVPATFLVDKPDCSNLICGTPDGCTMVLNVVIWLFSGNATTGIIFIPVLLTCMCYELQRQMLAPYRFHVVAGRSNRACLYVETMCKTYKYETAECTASVEPSRWSNRREPFRPPAASETCHIYGRRRLWSHKDQRWVVVELSTGVVLYLTPENPSDFSDAIRCARIPV